MIIDNAAFVLLLLGLVFIIAEAFIFSFGLLAITGIIAFIIGSSLLMDTTVAGIQVTWQLLVALGLITLVFLLVCTNLAYRSFRKKIVSGREGLLGTEGRVLEVNLDFVTVRIQGEIWTAECDKPLAIGQKIHVVKVSKLRLTVEPSSQKIGS